MTLFAISLTALAWYLISTRPSEPWGLLPSVIAIIFWAVVIGTAVGDCLEALYPAKPDVVKQRFLTVMKEMDDQLAIARGFLTATDVITSEYQQMLVVLGLLQGARENYTRPGDNWESLVLLAFDAADKLNSETKQQIQATRQQHALPGGSARVAGR